MNRNALTSAQATALNKIAATGDTGLLQHEIKHTAKGPRKGRVNVNGKVLRSLFDAGHIERFDAGDRYTERPRATYLTARNIIVYRYRLATPKS